MGRRDKRSIVLIFLYGHKTPSDHIRSPYIADQIFEDLTTEISDHQLLQHRLDGMEPVLALVEDERLGPVHHVVGDLLASVGRKAVQHDHVVACVTQEISVHVVSAEGCKSPLLSSPPRHALASHPAGAFRSLDRWWRWPERWRWERRPSAT